jgi:hypothetical protein
MVRTMKTALLAASLVAAATVPTAAQDQEAGEVELDPPARAVAVEREQEAEEEQEQEAAPAPESRRRGEAGKPGPLRVYGGFSVAIGGERSYERSFSRQLEIRSELDLDPTVGFQGGVDYVVHEYVSIGGEMRLLWSKVDGFDDRDFLWDLAVKPRGRYAFDDMPLEVYVSLPVGLTAAGIKGRAEGKAGFNIGLLAGANWFFTENMGVNLELGWLFHKYGIEVRSEIDGLGAFTAKGDIKANQFVLLCPNFIYAF